MFVMNNVLNVIILISLYQNQIVWKKCVKIIIIMI